MFRLADGQRILVLAPHADDGEFGCGGTIAKMVLDGAKVFYAALSIAEESVPEGMPKDTLSHEMKEATSKLGILPEYVRLFDYPVRRFPEFRQSILEDLIALKAELHPDLVFMPALGDTHQDHQVVAAEGFRAFKNCSILGYELPWNHISFPTDCFVLLRETHVLRKIAAVHCYISQMGRDYVDPDFLRSWARTRGGSIGTTYAEAFHVLRWIWQ